MFSRKVLSPKLRREFIRIFGFASPWDGVYGFDMLSFEDMLQPKDGESIADCTSRRYGAEGITLVIKLVGSNASQEEGDTLLSTCIQYRVKELPGYSNIL